MYSINLTLFCPKYYKSDDNLCSCWSVSNANMCYLASWMKYF
uniref:Uncharacterized protein n=1 Tax=Arundo donax TaxID=35708 RepID=A0A0A9EYD0_ARUDO